MTICYSLLSLVALLCAAFFLTRMLMPRTRVEGMLIFVLALSTGIIFLGYLTSAINQLRNLGVWALLSVLALALTCIPMLFNARIRTCCLAKLAIPRDIERRITGAGFKRFDTLILLGLAIAVAIVAVVNFLVLIGTEPANPDALDYHLPRIMYYLQHNNLRYFPVEYWAMVVHPKVSTILQLYTYLVSDLATNLTQLVQYLAYFVTMIAVYGITRQLGGSRRGSLFSALVFGLLIIVIMEAMTAQNDLIQAAFTACCVYFLLAYRSTRLVKYLWIASAAFALALGVKATQLLVVPSLLIVGVYAFLPAGNQSGIRLGRHLGAAALAMCLALAVITIPAGYGENFLRFGNPLGPLSVRQEHSFEGHTGANLPTNGGLNLLRYGFDALKLDGLPMSGFTDRLQAGVTFLPRHLVEMAGINLLTGEESRLKFDYGRPLIASENCSYWGAMGFLLIWPVVFLSLFALRQPLGIKLFAVATMVFLLVQAFASPYDPWRGRYFITAAIFAVPALAAVAFPRHLAGKCYITFVVLLGCGTAVFSACIHRGTYVFPFHHNGVAVKPTFAYDRASQLTRMVPDLYYPLLTYDSMVPEDAVVATDIKSITSEYIFIGDRLSRRVIPLHSFEGTHLPLPAEAQFLLYTPSAQYQQQKGDTPICVDHPFCGTLMLRRLK